MCDINTVGLGIRTAGVVSDTVQRFQADRINMEYQNARNKAILSNFANQSRELHNAYAQDYTANAVKRQQDYIKNLQARSAVHAGMASKGLNGNSVNNLFNSYSRAAAVSNYMYARDLAQRGLQYNDRMTDYRNSALNAISVQTPYQSNAMSILSGSLGNLYNNFDRYVYNYDNKNKNKANNVKNL